MEFEKQEPLDSQGDENAPAFFESEKSKQKKVAKKQKQVKRNKTVGQQPVLDLVGANGSDQPVHSGVKG